MTTGAQVRVLTRQGCHLCDEAIAIAEASCTRHGAELNVIDVDTDAELRAQYTDHVPVVFVNNELLSYWFVDPDRLENAILASA